MNYCLGSSRMIGNYLQKITVNWDGASRVSGVLDSMKTWVNKVSELDATGREVGVVEFEGFVRSEGSSEGNTGAKADASVTALCVAQGKPKYVMFAVKDVTVQEVGGETLVDVIDAGVRNLIGLSANNENVYITSIMFNLHD